MAQSRARVRQSDDGHPRSTGPRIQDVARHAGVAIGTVSNVLNNPDLVSENTRLKVEAAIASWALSAIAPPGRSRHAARIPSGWSSPILETRSSLTLRAAPSRPQAKHS
jgi:Bacterial regulatory proteins, lacI family